MEARTVDFTRLLQRQCLSLFEKAPIPFCLVSGDARPIFVNPAGVRVFLNPGPGGPENDGSGLATFFKSGTDQPFPLRAEMARAMNTGRAAVLDDLELRREEGVRSFTVTVLPLEGNGGFPGGAILIGQDRTAEREGERLRLRIAGLQERVAKDKQRLRTVSRRLLDIQESERRYIARELHDEIGQSLTALKIQLQTLQRRLPDPFMGSDIEAGVQTLDRLMRQVRNLSLELRPSVLDDLGLKAALRWYMDRVRQDSGLDIRLQMDFPDRGFGQDLDLVLFRVAQESLTNVVRHAGARQVDVRLIMDEEAARLSIRDDGVGFDVEEARARAMAGKSLGLIGMMERVNLVGGRVDLSSKPGEGTCFGAAIPLKGRADEASLCEDGS